MNSVHSRLRSRSQFVYALVFCDKGFLKRHVGKKISFWLCCKIHFSSAVYYVSVKTNLRNLILEVWLLFQMKQWKDSVCKCHGILKVLIQLCLPRGISHPEARKWYLLHVYPSLRPDDWLHFVKIKQRLHFFFCIFTISFSNSSLSIGKTCDGRHK